MKIIHFLVLFFSILIHISGLSTGNISVANNTEEEINSLVLQVADYLIERLPANTRVSLINISENELDLTNYILGKISSELVNSEKFVVVSRKDLSPIMGEIDFQLSGATSDETSVPIGRFLGAESVISCFVAVQNGNPYLFVRAIDVQTTQIKADRSFALASLSSGNLLVSSLPIIERISNINDPILRNSFLYPPRDEIRGLGMATVVENYDIAMVRSDSDIAREIVKLISKEIYETQGFTKEEIDYIFLPMIAILVSQYSNVERRFRDNDGNIFYVTSLKKSFVNKIVMDIEREINPMER